MKLKILAIHGYRQNGDVFRQKSGSFRKIVNKWAEFVYVTAPHKVTPVDDINNLEEAYTAESIYPDVEQLGWFFNRDNKTFRGIRKGGPAIGFEESLDFIEKVFEELGPFDGILSFSQGACFVGLLCDLQQRQMLRFSFDFAIFSSGFKSGSLCHLKHYSEKINIPTLHIFGENDKIIPTEMSVALRDCFENPRSVIHHGGHFLPASSAQKTSYQEFFKEMLELKDQQSKFTNS